MLHLIHSNHLERLALLLGQLTANDPLPPLQQEQIVVQNAGMGRWLSMRLAEQVGVAANMRYIFPAEMTWELLREVLPDVPERDPCAPKLLRWRLFEAFLDDAESYPELSHYLRPNDEGAAWQLAQQVATVLDGYLFFRPDWIQQWEQQPDLSDWQQRLWQRVVKEPELAHWVRLQQRFFAAMQQERALQKLTKKYKRLIFFSVPAVSEAYIRLINQVANYVEVYFFIVNPSEHYWSDIESERRKLKFDLNEQDYIEVGNPLLASWGTQGRDYIGNLRSLEPYPNELSAFVDLEEVDERGNMLTVIHTDMLQLQNPQVDEQYPIDLTHDHSVRLHNCHSPMREVEVLQDQLLAAFEQDSELRPSDIVVMMSDIDRYAPYIDAVFSTAEQNKYIPFSVADQSQRYTQNMTALCLQLLELPDSRFEAERVFALLENALLAEVLQLDEQAIQQCRTWVAATNIRWGVDAASRRKQGGAETSEHTWRYGLDRLLLGYAMPGEDVFTGILPFNHLEGSQAEILGRFLQFVDTLFTLSDWSRQRHRMGEWAQLWRDLLQRVFADRSEVQFIFNALEEITKQAEVESGIERSLSWRIFRDALRAQLEQRQQAEGFMGRGITFCALMPMRSVPFKMVALLGMQDGAFPRIDTRVSFDKLGRDGRRRGDRSRRDEDRYLFLESVLSARERLYISYVGQSIYDNSHLMPSVLVSELLDYIERRFGFTSEQLITRHPLQAFSLKYFTDAEGRLFTYRSEYARQPNDVLAGETVFWQGESLPPLSDDERQIYLEQLVAFYQRPAHEFLRRRLGVQLRDYEVELQTREPFALEAFEDQKIRRMAFDALTRSDSNDAALLERLRALGMLPHGTPGDLIWQQEQQCAYDLHTAVMQGREDEALQEQVFRLPLGGFELLGTLNSLSHQGHEVFYFDKLHAYHWVEVWLKHLVLNALPVEVELPRTTLVYSTEQSYRLAPVADAQAQLQYWLEQYWQGMQTPLLFSPKVSFALLDNKQREPNWQKAQDAWIGNDFSRGDGTKPENQLLFRGKSPMVVDEDQFQALAGAFWLPLLSHRSIL